MKKIFIIVAFLGSICCVAAALFNRRRKVVNLGGLTKPDAVANELSDDAF